MIDPVEIDELIDLYGWDKSDQIARFCALVILHQRKNLPPPSWDDFRLGIERT